MLQPLPVILVPSGGIAIPGMLSKQTLMRSPQYAKAKMHCGKAAVVGASTVGKVCIKEGMLVRDPGKEDGAVVTPVGEKKSKVGSGVKVGTVALGATGEVKSNDGALVATGAIRDPEGRDVGETGTYSAEGTGVPWSEKGGVG